jgi:hypothetical protein
MNQKPALLDFYGIEDSLGFWQQTNWHKAITDKFCAKHLLYGDNFVTNEIAQSHFKKVAALAARWSLDPAAVDEQLLNQASGTAGELSQLYWLRARKFFRRFHFNQKGSHVKQH